MPDLDDFVMGRIPIIELLKGNRDVNRLFIQETLSGDKISDIISLAKQKGIQIQTVPKTKLDTISQGGVHQGVIAAVAAYDYATLEDLFKKAEDKQEDPFFLILDGIEDPHNLGSIMRTADAVGVHGIIIPKRRAVGLTSTVAKTSTGAIEHVPVVRVTNLHQTIEHLKQRGVWIFATDMSGQSYTSWQVKGALALVIGNEGKGVSRLVKESADALLTIPMVGHVQSLNASVATGILLYEVFRGRRLS
ncbi:23S rRNA (guanosine(2251)-2'-O)-methyltransferase RlmB [Granulicatella sp. zg-ZJ]|uniref:23S rRNA (guanosine(2251)-2'-O)-methyltransferase RlmB n=1 Tax=unclassified Granulicatella TaxID=2630493 RepID=UPI0013BF97D4|nr:MULTISPECIES: 23S rRNA (guanosine(2251)-2'-O)-methyltransferase RlmB [unclassified Granulicatella]MBS4750279.1 23S rRNA (guanosine(2251)-2'-O)-methyltransferase RlmB [Carnobacteriaceae bacterium zg-ZUI78]NEW62521.1 23S rRNA (guanosine(2251)-2'-O)-methyltransferase RlmB [Granulicatella sp. zg-ZJ]NEW66582.1 23S rRNA (guanosine(2251)-2'-O)-methyltransferase RlmB [Granulicatella sp. zg-84]QMI86700.1 23S rRNA (guanosine(2251)-2'-O)-methyltransferase RlmB [Carnobacteriaceae bacterium zg-84]